MMWGPVWLSLRVASFATLLVLVSGTALAWLLAHRDFPGKQALETVTYMPLVLPPTVVGFFLLVVVGRNGLLGMATGVGLTFTLVGAVLASTVVALPLMVQTARAAITEVNPELEEAAAVMGASGWQTLWLVTLPLARRGIVTGAVLSFARALGEFGATLMVAGNIPGRTQTVPLAIYTAVQTNDGMRANMLVLVMTVVAFVIVWVTRKVNGEDET
jgi:molybdate transport system permease protein